MKRRDVLLSLVAVGGAATTVRAEELRGYPSDMALNARFVPEPVIRGQAYKVLTDETARRNVAAIFDCLIPADELGPSASQAGCVDFLDAQLAGPFGEGLSLYREKPEPVDADAVMQTPQFIATPRERYITGLAALETYTKAHFNASFADLSAQQQETLLTGMDGGQITLARDVNTKAFFELLLQNVREGYFADPIYGGNKDMAGWKMIGFPGARYDYRLYADRTGQKLDLEPVSLIPQA